MKSQANMERLLICCLVCAYSASMVWCAPPRVLYGQLLKNVESLKIMVKRDDAEELHAPMDVEVNCQYIAVSCFINATLYLKPIEQPVGNKDFNDTLARIQSVHQNFLNRVSEQKCPRCIDYPKQSPRDFLDKFRLLLQQLYRNSWRS